MLSSCTTSVFCFSHRVAPPPGFWWCRTLGTRCRSRAPRHRSMGSWRFYIRLRGIPTNFIGDTSDPTPVFPPVCDLFETRRGFVDGASSRQELVRGVEEVIGCGGLERI